MLKPMKLLFLMICLLPSLVFGDSRPDVIPISNVAAKNAYDKTYAKGLELFNKRCKTAGRKIKSIVFGEIGIRIDTPRAERSYDRFSDKLWSDAGLPVERVGDKFIASFLDFYFNDSTLPSFAPGLDGTVLMQGFQFVDVKQADGTFLRYKLAGDDPSKGMTQMSIPSSQASRYAVIISPLGTNEERENWVAGAHIMAMDTKTKQVLGETRTFSYALPPVQKDANLQLRDWSNRLTCPNYQDIEDAMVRIFLINVVNSKPH